MDHCDTLGVLWLSSTDQPGSDMKWILALLVTILIALQYRLWVGEGSWADVTRLEREVREQERANEQLQRRNRNLAIEVEALKEGLDSVEERAREDLGMIKDGETFYMIIEKD